MDIQASKDFLLTKDGLLKCAASVWIVTLFFAASLLSMPREAGATLSSSITADSLGMTISYPDDWSVAPKRLGNMTELINVPASQQNIAPITASIKIRMQKRTDHNEALGELREIAAETGSPWTFFAIGGWPALQRRNIEKRQQPNKGQRFEDEWVLQVTTAVAAGNILVRIDAALPSEASPELISTAETIGRSLIFTATGDPAQVQQEIESLSSGSVSMSLFAPSVSLTLLGSAPTLGTAEGFPGGAAGFTQRLYTGGNGELEIAASPNAQTIVVARQNNWQTSNDGGQTFAFSGNINLGDGDPSLAYGQSGNFYLAGISINCLPADATGPFGYDCTGILRSTDNGHTFPFLSNAVACPKDDPNAPPNPHLANRCFPDQEHIAADRFNAAAGNRDQVYSTWRNFDATDQDPAIVCSQDSGATWTAPVDVDSGFIPRISVGQDGFVYVVYRSGNNIRINKYSSCASGLVVQPTFPKTIASVNDVTCPVPGLDRCNDGNNLSSIMVAVDDTSPNHVYVAYANETVAGNQNILVRDSLDGGVTWPGPRVVTVNGGVSGVRFMPWICSTGGNAYVTWYDRRASTPCPVPPCPANNDLTDFYAGTAGLELSGNLVAGGEFKITDAADPQCASGWPCAPRATGDSESCSVQPQLAGVCCDNTKKGCPGSQQRCDFSSGPACPNAGETCNGDGGCPKYGDYNGNACIAGRLLAGWSSATPPPGMAASGSIDVFFAQFLVGSVPQIKVPGGVPLADTCVGSTSTGTLNVCNTGNANLEIIAISSSNSQFGVTKPTSGFPVEISPDFCFPFEVKFAPTSAGSQSSTLTIQSNDPANSSVSVQAIGTGAEPAIATLIANSGNFGDVCVGSFSDLNLTISNSGGCRLSVTNIVSSSPDFKTASALSFPLTIAAGNSLQVPIRFQPTTAGAKTANITISSNDPAAPSTVVAVSGNAPSPVATTSGALDFGQLCSGDSGTQTVQLCDTGKCDLTVTGATLTGPNCADFTLISPSPSSLPLTVSPDSCFGFVIRFTPTSLTPPNCSLVINTSDPANPTITFPITAAVGAPHIVLDPAALSGMYAFPPTVVDANGSLGCYSEKTLVIRNNGTCPLNISGIAATAPFMVIAPTQFPLILPPGEETLNVAVRFVPTTDGSAGAPNETIGTLTVMSNDPGGTASESLCGEAVVQSGVRVLVVNGSDVPIAGLDSLTLTSKGVHTPNPISIRLKNVSPATATVCGNTVQYHLGSENLPPTQTTGSNPNSSYNISAKEGNKQASQSFSLGQCEFKEFVLKLQ